MKKYQKILSENFQFLEVNFSIYLNRRVLVMNIISLLSTGFAKSVLHVS